MERKSPAFQSKYIVAWGTFCCAFAAVLFMVFRGLCVQGNVFLVLHITIICTFKWHFVPLISGISPSLRKIVLKLKLKKIIELQGDQFKIKTASTFRNYTFSFRVGQEFEEFTKGLDNRHVKVRMNSWSHGIKCNILDAKCLSQIVWWAFYFLLLIFCCSAL